MLDQRTVHLNGSLVPWDQATVHLMSHSFGRGSALFEVMSLHDTESGPAVFRLGDHLDRLANSVGLLGFELPLSKKDLARAVLETIRANGLKSGAVKILAYLGDVAFAILSPQEKLDLAIIAMDPEEDLGGLNVPPEGVSLCLSKWRKLHPESVPIQAKAAANYLNGMMSRIEARDKGFDTALMLDSQGFVAEGGTESVFVVDKGRLLTPSLGTVLASITRDSVIKVARSLDLEVSETRITPERLYSADEAFLTGTPVKVLPVRAVEQRSLETPGPITARLGSFMEGIVSGREKSFSIWLDSV